MGTAGTLRTWTRPEAAPELRPPDGCACDLCRDDAEEPITARPPVVRPATATPVRQVERQRLTVEDCDAVFGRELADY